MRLVERVAAEVADQGRDLLDHDQMAVREAQRLGDALLFVMPGASPVPAGLIHTYPLWVGVRQSGGVGWYVVMMTTSGSVVEQTRWIGRPAAVSP